MKDKTLSTPGGAQLLYDVDDRPPLQQTIPFAIQHVFAMFGATILVPVLVNTIVGYEAIPIPVAIFMSGVGTIIYQICTKRKSPVYLGSSFAFISPIALACQTAGVAGAMTGLAVVGLIYVIFALIVFATGKGWIDKLLPPVVIGPMIMIIGLGLASSAISQIGLDNIDVDWRHLVVALVTLATAVIFMVFVKGFFNVIPFLMAIVFGYLSSIVLGLVDFTAVKEASWIAVPRFQIMFYHYAPSLAAVWQIAPVALVTMAEHIGDHEALSTITGRDLLKNPGLAFTLLGDGLATLVAALFGGPANTTYGENTAVVGMTRNASVYVLRWAAILAIAMSFMGKLTALISAIPGPVLGGVSLLLYGFIALNGAKVWVKNRTNFGCPRNIVITAIMLCLGLGGAVFAIPLGKAVVSFSGMSFAAIAGIALNQLLPQDKNELAEKRQQALDDRRLEVLHSHPELLAQVDVVGDVAKLSEKLDAATNVVDLSRLAETLKSIAE